MTSRKRKFRRGTLPCVNADKWEWTVLEPAGPFGPSFSPCPATHYFPTRAAARLFRKRMGSSVGPVRRVLITEIKPKRAARHD